MSPLNFLSSLIPSAPLRWFLGLSIIAMIACPPARSIQLHLRKFTNQLSAPARPAKPDPEPADAEPADPREAAILAGKERARKLIAENQIIITRYGRLRMDLFEKDRTRLSEKYGITLQAGGCIIRHDPASLAFEQAMRDEIIRRFGRDVTRDPAEPPAPR